MRKVDKNTSKNYIYFFITLGKILIRSNNNAPYFMRLSWKLEKKAWLRRSKSAMCGRSIQHAAPLQIWFFFPGQGTTLHLPWDKPDLGLVSYGAYRYQCRHYYHKAQRNFFLSTHFAPNESTCFFPCSLSLCLPVGKDREEESCEENYFETFSKVCPHFSPCSSKHRDDSFEASCSLLQPAPRLSPVLTTERWRVCSLIMTLWKIKF